MSAKTIAKRTYRLQDLHWFAAASGDWNPIHVDPLAARRLIAGDVVIHGILTLLWAMDAHFAARGHCPGGVSASFHRPILLEEPLALTRETSGLDDVRLAITQAGEEMTTILLASRGREIDGAPANAPPPHADPIAHAFPDLKGLTGALPVTAEADQLRQAFPHAVTTLGILPVASIIGLSRIVGMHCPGLHSLFTGLNLRFEPALCEPLIRWQVVRHTIPQAPVRIAVAGGGLSGQLDAFVRPPFTAQPTIANVARSVAGNAFAGQVALIIGGSRGLGELTAKLVAAGNGRAIVTYRHGSADAQRVADEIAGSGKYCRTLKLDVAQPDEAVATLISDGISPTHVYYFASPRIGHTRNRRFDAGLFANLSRIYVDAFACLAILLAKEIPSGIKMFYPSTVFLDELPRDFAEYIAAKAAGEALCKYLERYIPGLTVLVRRLPRLPTDQTAGLIRQTTEDPLRVLLGVVNEMHAPAK